MFNWSGSEWCLYWHIKLVFYYITSAFFLSVGCAYFMLLFFFHNSLWPQNASTVFSILSRKEVDPAPRRRSIMLQCLPLAVVHKDKRQLGGRHHLADSLWPPQLVFTDGYGLHAVSAHLIIRFFHATRPSTPPSVWYLMERPEGLQPASEITLIWPLKVKHTMLERFVDWLCWN